MGTGGFQRPVLTVVVVVSFDGWPHADLAVQASVVPPVDVLEQRELELFQGSPGSATGDQFGLQLADGRLDECVIDAVADAADGGDRADRVQGVGVANGQVLAAGVGVRDQPVEPAPLPGPHRQLEGLKRQLGAHVPGQRPADDAAAEHVDDQCQVGEADPGADVGQIAHPQPVRPVRR